MLESGEAGLSTCGIELNLLADCSMTAWRAKELI